MSFSTGTFPFMHTSTRADSTFQHSGFVRIIATVIATVVGSAVVTMMGICILLLVVINKERRNRMWARFEKVRDRQQRKRNNSIRFTKRHMVQPVGSTLDAVDSNKRPTVVVDDDDDTSNNDNVVTQLQSYMKQRRQKINNCSSNTGNDNNTNTIHQEVREWKQIQTNVRQQLTELNTAVQQVQQRHAHDRLPNLIKDD